MSFSIDSNLELCEIINAFPIIVDRLNELNFKINGCREGESMIDFFLRNNISKEEAEIIIARLNYDIRYFMKKGCLPECKKLRDEKEVIILDD